MKTVTKLQLLVCVTLAPAAFLAIVCELGLQPDIEGCIEEPLYILQTMACMYTLIFVPLSQKWMHMKRVKDSILESGEQQYFAHSLIALVTCCGPAEAGIFLYYMMLDTSMLFCALIALVGLVILWPTQRKMEAYLQRLAEEDRINKEDLA